MNLPEINSTTTGTHALTKTGGGVISGDYLNIQHSVASPADTWYAGTHSTNNQATANIEVISWQNTMMCRVLRQLGSGVSAAAGWVDKGIGFQIVARPTPYSKSPVLQTLNAAEADVGRLHQRRRSANGLFAGRG